MFKKGSILLWEEEIPPIESLAIEIPSITQPVATDEVRYFAHSLRTCADHLSAVDT